MGYNSPYGPDANHRPVDRRASQMAGAQGRDDGLLVDRARPVSSAGGQRLLQQSPIAAWRASGRLYLAGSGRRP